MRTSRAFADALGEIDGDDSEDDGEIGGELSSLPDNSVTLAAVEFIFDSSPNREVLCSRESLSIAVMAFIVSYVMDYIKITVNRVNK